MTNVSNQWQTASEEMINYILQNDIYLDGVDLWQECQDQTDQVFNGQNLSAEEEAAAVSSCFAYLCFSEEQRRSQNSLSSRIKSGTMNFLALLGAVFFVLILFSIIFDVEGLEINLPLYIQSLFRDQGAVGG